MSVETLGEAYRLGWQVTAKCAYGNRQGLKTIRECAFKAKLHLPTLVWTRGADFPLARLESRLKCPACGSRRVTIMFDVPALPQQNRISTGRI